jgi:hypothetical protein
MKFWNLENIIEIDCELTLKVPGSTSVHQSNKVCPWYQTHCQSGSQDENCDSHIMLQLYVPLVSINQRTAHIFIVWFQ